MISALCAIVLLQGDTTNVDAVLRGVNAIRKEIGLKPVVLDKRLSVAADAHSRYMEGQKMVAHIEVKGKPGFTGAAPWDRTKVAGSPGLCYEAVTDDPDMTRGVRRLFDAPNHRIGFLQPTATVGIGVKGRYLTIVFSAAYDGVACSPSPSQRSVSTSWDGFDSPDPLPRNGLKAPVGYPIVFANFSLLFSKLKDVSVTVTDSRGGTVPGFLYSPDNDPWLVVSAYMIPTKPLSPNSTYSVRAKAMVAGKPIEKTWSFTTAP